MTCLCSGTSKGTQVGAMQVLRNEHRVIERVLDALEARLDQPLDAAFFRQSMDFHKAFADRCHHAKEEKELLPILESAGVPYEGGPIACMLSEHEKGREYIRVIGGHLDAAGRGDMNAERAIRNTTAAYIARLRANMLKEENILFRLAEDALGPEEQELMYAVFERSDRANDSAKRRKLWVDWANGLSNGDCG